MLAASSPRGRATRPWWVALTYEFGLLGLLYAAYMIARGAIGVEVAEARDRGLQILAIERALRIDVERPMNDLLTALPAAGVAFAYLYATLHYVITPAVLVWVALRGRSDYAQARNSLLFATVAGLLTYWLLPTAPPRLLDIGLVDTLAAFSHVGWWGEAASAPRGLESFSNQYAALPSLHVGWAVWVAVWVSRHAPAAVVRRGIWAYPLVMSVVVMATANHYLIDVIAGVLCVALGGWLASRLAERQQAAVSAGATSATAAAQKRPARGTLTPALPLPLGAVVPEWNPRHHRRPTALVTVDSDAAA
jgi:hypothetical protein